MKKKILIIEDNLDLQEIYKINFEAAGFLTYVCTDGMKGLTKLLGEKFDVILLDIMMPKMDGFEVLETIKRQSSITVPVVICSNLSQESDIKRAFEL